MTANDDDQMTAALQTISDQAATIARLSRDVDIARSEVTRLRRLNERLFKALFMIIDKLLDAIKPPVDNYASTGQVDPKDFAELMKAIVILARTGKDELGEALKEAGHG